MNLFQVTISFQGIDPNTGIIKPMTEQYLIDALSFTEAEARAIEEFRPQASGEFSVSKVSRTRVAEVFEGLSGADRYYRCKVAFIVLDEKSGAEKRSTQTMIVHASFIGEALKRLEAGMAPSLSDWTIISITETAIVNVLPYKAPQQ